MNRKQFDHKSILPTVFSDARYIISVQSILEKRNQVILHPDKYRKEI